MDWANAIFHAKCYYEQVLAFTKSLVQAFMKANTCIAEMLEFISSNSFQSELFLSFFNNHIIR